MPAFASTHHLKAKNIEVEEAYPGDIRE